MKKMKIKFDEPDELLIPKLFALAIFIFGLILLILREHIPVFLFTITKLSFFGGLFLFIFLMMWGYVKK